MRKGGICSEHLSDHLPALLLSEGVCRDVPEKGTVAVLEGTETVLVMFKVLLRRRAEVLNVVFEVLKKYVSTKLV